MSAATFDGVVVKSKIEFVQALRGVAALAVVLWHASRYLGPYGTGIGAKLFLPGQMGVDLFFIISGFIMTVTTQSNDGSTKSSLEFFAKRFAKIWPFYAIATILFLIVARTDLRFLFDFEQFQRLLKGLLFLPSGSATELAPSFAWPPLPIGWTLNYEIYFYLFFGTLMLFGKLRWFAFTTWIVLTLCIVPFYIYAPATLAAALSPMARPPYANYLDLLTNPIIFEFVAGVIIGKIYLSPFEIWSRFYANLLVFLTVALVVWQYASHFRLGHGLSGFGFSLVPAFLVLCIASKTLDLSVPKPAVYLGEISYSLYLFHPLVQEGADRYLIRLGFGNLLSGPAPIFATTVLSIAVAGLSYRYIERGLSERMRLSLMRTIHRQTPGSGQFGGGEAAHDDG